MVLIVSAGVHNVLSISAIGDTMAFNKRYVVNSATNSVLCNYVAGSKVGSKGIIGADKLYLLHIIVNTYVFAIRLHTSKVSIHNRFD